MDANDHYLLEVHGMHADCRHAHALPEGLFTAPAQAAIVDVRQHMHRSTVLPLGTRLIVARCRAMVCVIWGI